MRSTQEITQQVQELGQWIPPLREQVGHVVVGQKYLVDRLLLGLLANGHILLEGVPGLAKTLTVKTMAACIQTGFQRLQFTPDLLPADLIGTLIYNPRSGEFTTKLGPIFSNLILADEINRAPAKVQSALLEAMQERQVTIGETTCQILHLDLGPLNLDLLGLQIDLSRIVLDITAQAGAGNLLGNLLCGVANLLNDPGGLARLLNSILDLLR